MKTRTTLINLFTSLSNNTSTANQTLAGQLISDQHRYLIQKYFDNERSVTTTTVGGGSYTLTAAPALGDTSATLSVAWPYPTCTQLVNFSNGDQREVLFTYNSTAITWQGALAGTKLFLTGTVNAGATSATLQNAWSSAGVAQTAQFSSNQTKTVTFTNGSAAITWAGGLTANVANYIYTSTYTTAITTVGVQYYRIPANVSKIKNDTITVGQLRYTPKEIKTRTEWDLINMLPYTSDIPQYYFIWNGQLGIFPIPSTTGNVLQFNYQTRVADLSFDDYSTGNITAATPGTTAITGSGTNWSTTGAYPTNTDLTYFNLYLRINPPYGDGIWYQIQKFNSGTSLTLANPIVNAPNITASSTYTIGQLPLLSEDFHDMLVYGALMTYYTSIVPDTSKFKQFETLYLQKLELLSEYAGTKSTNVDLGEEPQLINPNLFLYAN